MSSNEDSGNVGEESIAAKENHTKEDADDHEFDHEESDGVENVEGDFEEAGNGEPSCSDKCKRTDGQAQQLNPHQIKLVLDKWKRQNGDMAKKKTTNQSFFAEVCSHRVVSP